MTFSFIQRLLVSLYLKIIPLLRYSECKKFTRITGHCFFCFTLRSFRLKRCLKRQSERDLEIPLLLRNLSSDYEYVSVTHPLVVWICCLLFSQFVKYNPPFFFMCLFLSRWITVGVLKSLTLCALVRNLLTEWQILKTSCISSDTKRPKTTLKASRTHR